MKLTTFIENNTTKQQNLFLDLSIFDFLKNINKLSSEVFLPCKTDLCSFLFGYFNFKLQNSFNYTYLSLLVSKTT